jgi:hypothetical protein
MQIASVGEEQGDGLRQGTPALAKAIAQGGQDAHPGCMQRIARLLRGLGNDPLNVFERQHRQNFTFICSNRQAFYNATLLTLNIAISLP